MKCPRFFLAMLLGPLPCAAMTFFITDHPESEAKWQNCCPVKVCKNRNWLQAPEVDYRYNFGIALESSESVSIPCGPASNKSIVVESPLFEHTLAQRLALSQGRIVIFVHGYNVRFEDGLASMNKIAGRLEFASRKAIPLLFSWNSQGSLAGYTRDEEFSRIGGVGLAYVLRALAKLPEVSEIHIIAHSMGNRVAVDALERATWMLDAEGITTKESYRNKIRSVSYFSSDLSAEEHTLKTVRIHRFFVRSQGVVFFSDKDMALNVSNQIHRNMGRAGQTSSGLTFCDIDKDGNVSDKVVIPSIDASSLGRNREDILGHSYILRSKVIQSHLEHLIFNTPFDYETHYQKSAMSDLSALGGTSVKAILDCSDESWVLEKSK
jgi:hypothetical protein